MQMNFTDKIIWITGASSGIGEALAVEWAAYKPGLIISGRNLEKLAAVQAQCERKGARCVVIPVDVASPESIDEAAQKAFKSFGRVDILVNNSGISQRSLAVETPLAVDRKIMETNFFGAVAKTLCPPPGELSFLCNGQMRQVHQPLPGRRNQRKRP